MVDERPFQTLSAEEVKQLVSGERARILRELDALSTRDVEARQAEAVRRFNARLRMGELLADGKSFGLSMVEMSVALGLTRQMAHGILRDYEEAQASGTAKRKRRRKGGDRA